MEDQLNELAKQYFEAYPAEDVLHISSDNQVFLQANLSDAVNHQRKLDEKQALTTFRRKEFFAEPEQEGGNDKIPDASWTKEQLVEWLANAGVEADKKLKKEELLVKVQEVLDGETNDN